MTAPLFTIVAEGEYAPATDTAPAELTITVVPDAACPECGAAWGHPNPALDFPNRPKIGDENGDWWWRCYNPLCTGDTFYYLP